MPEVTQLENGAFRTLSGPSDYRDFRLGATGHILVRVELVTRLRHPQAQEPCLGWRPDQLGWPAGAVLIQWPPAMCGCFK